LFATRIGAFFGLDVVVSAIVLFVFIATEGRRMALSTRWLPVVATLRWPCRSFFFSVNADSISTRLR
jgi:hypothetical protein